MKSLLLISCVLLTVAGCKRRSMNDSDTKDIVDASGNPNQPTRIYYTSCSGRITSLDSTLNKTSSFLVVGKDSAGDEALFFVNGSCNTYENLSSEFEKQNYVAKGVVLKLNQVSFSRKLKNGEYEPISALRYNEGQSLVGWGITTSSEHGPCMGYFAKSCNIIVSNGKFKAPYLTIIKRVQPEDFNAK